MAKYVPDATYSLRRVALTNREGGILANPGAKNIVSLEDWSPNNYFHFVLEALPLMLTNRKKYGFYIPAQLVRIWQGEWLDLLGMDWAESRQVLKSTHKIRQSAGVYPTRESVATVRSALSLDCGPPAINDAETEQPFSFSRPLRALHIERRTGLKRKIASGNLREMFLFLNPEINLDVAHVDFDGIPVREQLSLVDWADFAVGISGAGFANFALRKVPNTCTLIELSPRNDSRFQYERLAKSLEMGHRRIIVDNLGSDLNPDGLAEIAGLFREVLTSAVKQRK